MTAYIVTPAQHAQLIKALKFAPQAAGPEDSYQDEHFKAKADSFNRCQAALAPALAMLKAMKPVELYGWGADSGIVGDCVGPNDRNRDETEYTIPLYAMETKV